MVAVAERGTRPVENIMVATRGLMTQWFDGLRTARMEFPLPSDVAKVFLRTPQLSIAFGIPGDVERKLRKTKTWLLLRPQGEAGWICSIIRPSELSGETGTSIIRRTYVSLLELIASTQAKRVGVGDDTELVGLQETATQLFDALPRGIQQQLTNEGLLPHTVFSTIQG